MWAYLAHGSHDTLGNKHSHFLSGRLNWINKQGCTAAAWRSRDKPPRPLPGGPGQSGGSGLGKGWVSLSSRPGAGAVFRATGARRRLTSSTGRPSPPGPPPQLPAVPNSQGVSALPAGSWGGEDGARGSPWLVCGRGLASAPPLHSLLGIAAGDPQAPQGVAPQVPVGVARSQNRTWVPGRCQGCEQFQSPPSKRQHRWVALGHTLRTHAPARHIPSWSSSLHPSLPPLTAPSQPTRLHRVFPWGFLLLRPSTQMCPCNVPRVPRNVSLS